MFWHGAGVAAAPELPLPLQASPPPPPLAAPQPSDSALAGAGGPLPEVGDLVERASYYFIPGRERPIGRITKWSIGRSDEQISASCLIHGNRCRRIFSSAQQKRWGISGLRDLQRWLLWPLHQPDGMAVQAHGMLPKPLPGHGAAGSSAGQAST